MARAKQTVDTENSQERKSYLRVLEKVAAEGFCPFCEKNLSRTHPRPILTRGTHWLVTPSNWPYPGSKSHLLLISRKHIERVEQVTPAAWAELHKHLQAYAKKYNLKGMTFFMRSGDTAYTSASVAHLHAHVVSGGKRKKNSREITAPIGFEK
ncbi:MAG TPA: HIT domain-containing protein [Candidatus Paceibacterota bacterium]|nr:HIT domain-containing protein [Candidatus Paceibacterota bacterium]